MFGKLSVALLLIAAPALAQEAPPADQSEGTAAEAPKPVAYKIKKICRSVEVVGSSIPRTTCTTKKIPIKPAEEEADADNKGAQDPQSQL
jgi:hypothetical protein